MPLPNVDVEGIPGWAAGILLLAFTISVAGIADNALSNAGYGFLGIYVWAVCYAGALLVVWFVWLRDIELVGAAGNERKR